MFNYSDMLHQNQDPPCKTRLQSSFLKHKDSFMYPDVEYVDFQKKKKKWGGRVGKIFQIFPSGYEME